MNEIADNIRKYVLQAERGILDVFMNLDDIEAYNQEKVLNAFQHNAIALRHFAPTTGYGYDDIGRDALDAVFAASLDAEDALVRPQLTSGTHAIFMALCGLLEPGDTLLTATGAPYDTLLGAIGITGDEAGSLKRRGIFYKQLELANGHIDTPNLLRALKEDDSITLVYFQRSRGYSWRNAVSPEAMGAAFAAIKAARPDALIFVDNCYGEFTQKHEPTYYGADVIAGSLIKNPGGGIAPTGGYIAGKKTLVERIANSLTVPGMGREVGSYAGGYAPFFEGLFLAPHTTVQSLKTAALFARVFEMAGMETLPASTDERYDIVQSLRFPTAEALVALVRSIQKAAPVDSSVSPEPWDMPGYNSKVIMAAGAFTQGSSIELSADAPMVEPYTAYIQGGLTFAHGRIGVMYALDALVRAGEISLK